MSTVQNIDPVLGFWTNHAEGWLFGSVYTTSQRNGGLFLAFMALYTSAALSHAFGIVRFLAFYFRSSPEAKKGLFHQHQATLRNRSSPAAMLWDSMHLWFSWRGKGKHTNRSTIGFTFFSLIGFALIVGLSTFSSTIESTPNLVLMQEEGRECGLWRPVQNYWANASRPGDDNMFNVVMSRISKESIRLARQCYAREKLTDSPDCIIPGRLVTNWTSFDAECPLGPGSCEEGTTPITFESEYIDSLKNLGINTPPGQNAFLKFNQTCAPIDVSEWVETQVPIRNDTAGRLFYGTDGRLTKLKLGAMQGPFYENISDYETVVMGAWYRKGPAGPSNSNTRTSQLGYVLEPQVINFVNNTWTSGTFIARDDIPWLRVQDGSITLLVLGNYNNFQQEVNDPWFRATADDRTGQNYISDQVLNVVACTAEHYVCPRNNREDDGCIRVFDESDIGVRTVMEKANEFTPEQKLLIPRLVRAATISDPYAIALNLGAEGLLANRQAWNYLSSGLPDDQWKRELESIFSMQLMAVQIASTEFARNRLQIDMERVAPADNQTIFCRNQMFPSDRYQNFSVFGIGLIVLLGFLFFIVDMTLPSLIARLPPKSHSKNYRLADWIFHNFYQLQRISYETNECGRWDGRDKIPVTERNEKFITPLAVFEPSVSRANMEEGDMFLQKQSQSQSQWDSPSIPHEHQVAPPYKNPHVSAAPAYEAGHYSYGGQNYSSH